MYCTPGPSHGFMLNWQLHLKIAPEAVQGLEHLHEHCKVPIIHGNFKASNVLFDSPFNAKVSDFGFKLVAPEASLLDENRKQVPGACGYMAPEYLMDGNQFPPLSRLHARLCSADDNFHAQKFDEDF
ncbi:hypothetical protein CY35_10G093700 [Sphagnum magellanicum]|nr:hypothetical protein CY35_10G093700 [Sphagnum magellanicum]